MGSFTEARRWIYHDGVLEFMWNPADADDAFWAVLRAELAEDEIVELGYWIGFTYGGQRLLKTLGVVRGQLESAAARANQPLA